MTSRSKRRTLNIEGPMPNIESAFPPLGVGRSALYVFCFNLVPNRVQFGKIHIAELLSAGSQFILQQVESADELIGCRLERRFGIELALSGKIHGCEKQVADFVFNRGPIFALDCLL